MAEETEKSEKPEKTEKSGKLEKSGKTEQTGGPSWGAESAALEKWLQFEEFSHRDAWDTAIKILKLYKKMTAGREIKKGIGIRIAVDGTVVFQYLMDGKKDDSWLVRKQNTVERFGHSSMYLWEVNERTHEYENLKTDPRFAVCGGAFPLIIGGEVKGAAAVSGLVHYEDHELVVQALKELKEEKEERHENRNSGNRNDRKSSDEDH
ncbi:MAG TPA: heme-binding protein [Candidatus Lachnoclostridium pullistercoris]|uniref:Heme-binding protein n=1 Tax=Candidatus Lachnoclostridium pullistercoris TaxID=2838632 RepID=A0A9D2PB31_9FIRM|nr:heme-binding protein [Candidatus Lachnoclostridium pullistercoris]